MPLQGFHIKEPKQDGATVISIAPLHRCDDLIPWLDKLGPFTRDHATKVPNLEDEDEEKIGLWIRVYPPETASLLKLSETRHEELATALLAILNQIVAVAENDKPVSLVPIAEQCHEHLDILTFVDSPYHLESPFSRGSTDIALRLLPVMLRQLRSKYGWILIDLPEFWYPQVQTIVEISTHWLIPYEVANKRMLDTIFAIKPFFMSLRKSGAPFDCSGIIPIFTGRDPSSYADDLVNLDEIFGPRLWLRPPDSNSPSQDTLDVDYGPSLIRFYELTKEKKYGAKKLEIFNKAFILLSKPNGYLEKTVLDQLTDNDPYMRLIQLLAQRTKLSREQEKRIKSLSYPTIITVMQFIYGSTYKISIDYILAALDIKNPLQRRINLVQVVSTSDPTVKTLGKLLGTTRKNADHYFFKLWLTKELTLEFCKRKMGYI
ncbi:MAG: hypothetical protein JNM55_13320 [Anaerolineales bacterium]|nr:hypothetical protein [Anaerolineales bacterium]